MTEHDIQAGCFGTLFARKTRLLTPSSSVDRQSRQVARSVDQNSNALPEKEIRYFSPGCDFSYSSPNEWWTPGDDLPPSYASLQTSNNDVSAIIECALDTSSPALRDLSLKIHGHPEIAFHERYAHNLLTNFMAAQGFRVTKHYLGLSTAWRAEYTQGRGGRVIGINSEMDALPAIGHGCGHNLIAISGVGVAIALKVALQARPHTSGKIVLLGTPAEEGGGGKVILLERGAYDDMDICLMCHPGAGPPHSTSIGSSNAMESIQVEYFGHAAHAGGAPWEGTNALDAAFLAYSSISMLRQQMKPDHRVHGVVQGKDWVPNIIPDYSKMHWLARAPTSAELGILVKRVQNCLEAAALATGCRIEIKQESPYFDLHQNPVLAKAFADTVGSRYGLVTLEAGTSASTDFGNVSYALPALHPAFAIPTEPQGGNHTAAFAKAAISEAAHSATMAITKGLALTGYHVLTDSAFFNKVKASFENSKAARAALS